MSNSCCYSDKDNSREILLHEEDEETALPGFRFHPTDEELVGFYLRRKVEKKALSRIDQLIKQIDIYKYDPWDLPKAGNAGEREWYFFCMRGRKYRNSVRPNRVTGSGFWKATGIDKPICSTKDPHHQCVGLKKSLVYYRGSAGKGTKTDWMMHEFRLPPSGKPDDSQEAEVWTVCRILKRMPSYKKYTPASKLETKLKPSVQTNSNSKSCSLDSDLSFGDSVIQQTEIKPVLDHVGRSYSLFLNHHYNTITTQNQFMSSYPGFCNQDGDDLFGGNENWDELGSVVQKAVDPSQAYEYEWMYR